MNAVQTGTGTEDAQRLKLREEQLRVQKQPVETGEARLRKDVVSEQQSMDVPVTREDEGVGLCVGAYLGGTRGALICQNAGLLLAGNALAGYAHLHQIPMLILSESGSP